MSSVSPCHPSDRLAACFRVYPASRPGAAGIGSSVPATLNRIKHVRSGCMDDLVSQQLHLSGVKLVPVAT